MFGDTAFLFPVLTMFTWLASTGAAGLVLLMSLTAFAVIGFFRKRPAKLSAWFPPWSPPPLSGVLLAAMFVAILANFPLMLVRINQTSNLLLPGLIIAALVVGIVWALILRSQS